MKGRNRGLDISRKLRGVLPRRRSMKCPPREVRQRADLLLVEDANRDERRYDKKAEHKLRELIPQEHALVFHFLRLPAVRPVDCVAEHAKADGRVARGQDPYPPWRWQSAGRRAAPPPGNRSRRSLWREELGFESKCSDGYAEQDEDSVTPTISDRLLLGVSVVLMNAIPLRWKRLAW